MKLKEHLLPMALLVIVMLLAFSAVALTDDFEIPPYPQVPGEDTTTMEYVASFLLQTAGMKESALGEYPRDHIAMAKNVGLFKGVDFIQGAECSLDDYLKMANNVVPLFNALRAGQPAPLFVNGMAQPIFPYGNSKYYDTSGDGIVRFVVYVESDLDTDGDGKLDLVKTLVQLPKAALEGAKLATIFEARPYIEGTNGQSVAATIQTAGNEYLDNNPGFSHESLYATAAPRVPVGEASTAEMVKNADYRDWYYRYSGGSSNATITEGISGALENIYEDLNWYDYFLVRGFAVVESAGIGSAGSEGFATCGADVEINGFRCIIEWLAGDRKAYIDKTSNIEIKADWSNGKVGMTGRSYAGTTQFGLATTAVKGLETVVPVAGIASWYEYTNSQGAYNSNPYIVGLAWHVNSRLASADWLSILNRYAGYSQLMRREETALYGDYGLHWARRDYTVENWFRDWGPSKIKIPMLIVHGANDDNVRPKQSVLMYEAAKKAGVDVRWIWHQGHHMTPTYPLGNPNATSTSQPYSMYCGDNTYDEWLNMWFSYHLYGEDNNIMELLPGVLVQDNYSAEWVSYDSWDSTSKLVLSNNNRVRPSLFRPFTSRVYEEPEDYSEKIIVPDTAKEVSDRSNISTAIIALAAAEEDFTVIDSVGGSSSWQNFLDTPTAGSTLYEIVLPKDVTVKGVTQVNFRAAISSLGSSANEPLRVHAKLVEIAAPGSTLNYFGGNAMGSSIGVTVLEAGGSWQGGGIASHNLVRFNQATTGSYREIAKGWMDLCNPSAGYDSFTADRENRIVARENIGVFHDYSLYLQPAIHTAKAGNRLVLIITTGGTTNAGAVTGNNAFTFTIDNSVTYAAIPLTAPLNTFTMTFLVDGEIYDEQYVDHSELAHIPAEPEKEGYIFGGWFTEEGEEWDFATWVISDVTLYAQWTKNKPEGTITVNFPGINGATLQYYTNVSQWVTLGEFNGTGDFIIPEGHVATWGVTTVRVIKDGMYHTFTLDYLGESVVLDVPLATITVTGVASACNLAIVQNDWVYRYTYAAVGEGNGFLVFDNGKQYEVRLQKPGAAIISIKGINAGQTIDISTYF